MVTLDVLRPGEVFGEQALIGEGSHRSATVMALERTETLRLTKSDFESLWESHPGVTMTVAKMLDARLRATSQALLEALYLSAETRVMRHLSQLADIYSHQATVTIPSPRTIWRRWPEPPARPSTGSSVTPGTKD